MREVTAPHAEQPPMGPRPDTKPERDDTAIEPEPPAPESEPEAPKPEPVEPPKEEPKDKGPNGDTGIKKPKAKAKPRPKRKSAAKSASEKLAEQGERNRAKERELADKRKAEVKGAKTAAPRERSAEMVLANKATALATGGSVSKEGALRIGERKFGAAVNAGQVELVASKVKGKNILQWLGCKEIDLRRYAAGEIKVGDLPEAARKRLKELNGQFDTRLKMWPRKDAAILYVLQQERKKGSRPKKPAPVKPEPEKAAA